MWKAVNSGYLIYFKLNAEQLKTGHTVRIGLTEAYIGGRPAISVNAWNSPLPAATNQASTRSLTYVAMIHSPKFLFEDYELTVTLQRRHLPRKQREADLRRAPVCLGPEHRRVADSQDQHHQRIERRQVPQSRCQLRRPRASSLRGERSQGHVFHALILPTGFFAHISYTTVHTRDVNTFIDILVFATVAQ